MYWFMKHWYGEKHQFDDEQYTVISAELDKFNKYIKGQPSSDIQELVASSCQDLQTFLKAFQDNEQWAAKWITKLAATAYAFFPKLDQIEEYYYKPLANTEKDYSFPAWHGEFKTVTDKIFTFVSAEVGKNKILQKPNAYIQAMLFAMKSRQYVQDLDEMLTKFENGMPVSNDEMLELLDNINKDLKNVEDDLISKRLSKTSAKAAMWREIVKKQCQLYILMLEQMEKKHDGDTIIDEIKRDLEIVAEKVKQGCLYCLGNMDAFYTEEALSHREKEPDEELVKVYEKMRNKANDVDIKLIVKYGKKASIVYNAEPDEDTPYISQRLLSKKKENKTKDSLSNVSNGSVDDGSPDEVDSSESNVNSVRDISSDGRHDSSNVEEINHNNTTVEKGSVIINSVFSDSHSDDNSSIASLDEVIVDDAANSSAEDDLDSIQAFNNDSSSLCSTTAIKKDDSEITTKTTKSGGFWSWSWLSNIWNYFSNKNSLDDALSDLDRSFGLTEEHLKYVEKYPDTSDSKALSIGHRLSRIFSGGEFDEKLANDLFSIDDLNELMEYGDSDSEFYNKSVSLRCKELKKCIDAIDEANGDRKQGVTKGGVIDKLIMIICTNDPDFSSGDDDETITEQRKEKAEQVVIEIKSPQEMMQKEENPDNDEIVPQQQVLRNTTHYMQQQFGSDNNHDIQIKSPSGEKSGDMTVAPDDNGWVACGYRWFEWGVDKLLDVCCYGPTRRDHAADDDDIEEQDNHNTITI